MSNGSPLSQRLFGSPQILQENAGTESVAGVTTDPSVVPRLIPCVVSRLIPCFVP
jgi:hypothetical protein